VAAPCRRDPGLTVESAPKSKPPHLFVLDAHALLNPELRRMFSEFAVYVGNRLLLILRDHAKFPLDNGLWLVLSEGVKLPKNPIGIDTT
jgi:hypothetical protein